ncbi:nitroreductase/quinone reductase family protein, partial [Kitasatospora sp. NPDC127059]|uniref:nitroreductase/quinone reductase family protein n=1 Tax=Kitasatospora sp. NPDC127059 TaxID=3347120 RepID=UPI00366789A4
MVLASDRGSNTDPVRHRDLVAHPEITVEIGTARHPAPAAPVDPAGHDALRARQVAAQPQFAGYRTAARTVPLVALTRARARKRRAAAAQRGPGGPGTGRRTSSTRG